MFLILIVHVNTQLQVHIVAHKMYQRSYKLRIMHAQMFGDYFLSLVDLVWQQSVMTCLTFHFTSDLCAVLSLVQEAVLRWFRLKSTSFPLKI